METHPITREEVIRTLGDIDEETIADVISTGATASDLTLAIQRLRNEAASWNPRPQREPHIAAVCEALASWWELEEPEYVGTD